MPDSSPTRILVVDDEHIIADTLVSILRAAGYESTAAYNGAEAVNLASTFLPDIVIADYAMPIMNGLEAAAKIKDLLPCSKTIMLSAHSLGAQVAPYQAEGYSFLVLAKPIHPNDLLRHLHAQQPLEAQTPTKPRVLNVDDSEPHRYSISKYLAHSGFEVLEAATGLDALRRAIEDRPELVLLDIHLPDVDGYGVCTELRKNPDTSQLSVIHITASDYSPDGILRSANAGADAFVTHPIAPDALVQRIRDVLQAKYLRSA